MPPLTTRKRRQALAENSPVRHGGSLRPTCKCREQEQTNSSARLCPARSISEALKGAPIGVLVR